MDPKPLKKKLKLYGFNNLTKSLSFNLYDVCYATSPEHRQEYIEYVDEEYNAERLTQILTKVANIIGATILNIAKQDYDPGIQRHHPDRRERDPPRSAAICPRISVPCRRWSGPFGQSHITVHTYPESHPDRGVSTFRVDIDISTCGQISPLKA